MKHLLLTITLAVLLFSCCKKKTDTDTTPTLPPATQEGKNTFGCYVDGIPYVTKKGSGFNPDDINANIYNDSSVYISGNKGTPRWYLAMNTKFFYQEGAYFMGGTYPYLGNISIYTDGTIPNNDTEFSTDSINTGILQINKFDKVNRIISGTFNFKAKNGANKIINITDGRFDIKY
jgi:hypothetical protein